MRREKARRDLAALCYATVNDGGALFRRLCASNAAALPKRDSYVSAMHVHAEGQAEAEIGNVTFIEALVRLSAAM